MISLKSLLLFVLAGIFEIGGGYLIWKWIKENQSWHYGVFGFFILAGYGIIATFQTSNFAKVYASYGGIFVLLSFIWAFIFDNYLPDKFDIIGTLVILIGVGIIYYVPRTN